MLVATPSHPANLDNLTAIYNFYPRRYISAFARLTKARRPKGPVAPDADTLLALAKHEVTLDSFLGLNRALSTVTYGEKTVDRLAPLADNESFKALNRFISWLGTGAKFVPYDDFLFDAEIPATQLELLIESDSHGEDDDWGWLGTSEATALAFITLWCSYTRITSSFLTAEERPPENAVRDAYPLAVRLHKALALVVALKHSTSLSRLREEARLISSPLMQPLLQYISPTVRDEISEYVTKVLALRVHPWLATCERHSLTATRGTRWGRANKTFGASSSRSTKGLWDRLLMWHSLKGRNSTREVRDMLLDTSADGLLLGFYSRARELFLLRDIVDPGYLASATAILELASPSSPPPVHLFGQDLSLVVQSGYNANLAITDVFSLMDRPRYPLLGADGDASTLAGSIQAFEYNAANWVEGKVKGVPASTSLHFLPPPSTIPPLYVQPQQPEIPTGYGLEILTPSMIRPKTSEEYFGDEDAIQAPYTPEAVAEWLGYASTDEMREKIKPEAISHLFKWDEPKRKWVKPPEHAQTNFVFRSSRTMQPWRVRVELPVAIPTAVLALDHRTAPSAAPIIAVLSRTLELPTLGVGTLDAGDGLAREALKGLGFAATP